MAIAPVADRGSTVDTTSAFSTAVDIAAGASVTVGNYLIGRVSLDNSGAGGSAPTLSVSDPRTNTWTVTAVANQDPGSSSAGVSAYIFYAKVVNALVNGDDVTLTYNSSVPSDSVVIEEWSGIHATTPLAVAATTAVGVSTTPSIARTPAAVGQLFYGVLGIEGPVADTYTQDSDTTDGSWVGLTSVGGVNATADLNQTVRGAYKIVTGTSAQTWDPTITARDWAMVALVFDAAPTAAGILSFDTRRQYIRPLLLR